MALAGPRTRPPRPPPPSRIGVLVLRSQSDRRLLRLFRDGSEEAFEEIVRRHRAGLTAYAASISTPDRADDVVQDSLTRAYRFLGNGKGGDVEQLKAWLYRVVRNTALNDIRDEGRHEHDELDLNYDGVEQPPQAFERRAEVSALVAGLQGLPDAQRDALVKRELEGFGHEEIAADMGLSNGAVRQLIYRGRQALRDGLGMLLPIPLVRYLATGAGTNELAAGGAAGAGLGGATLLKGGAATAVVAASLFAGSKLKQDFDGNALTPVIEKASPTAQGAGRSDAAVALAGGAGQIQREVRRAGGIGGGSPGAHDGSSGGSGHAGEGGDRSSEGPSSGSDTHSGSGSHSDSGSGSGSHSGSDDGASNSGPGGGGSSGSGSGDDGVSGDGSGSGSGSGSSLDELSDSSGSGSSGSGSSGSDSSGSGSSGSGDITGLSLDD